jgi:hypothetical protein
MQPINNKEMNPNERICMKTGSGKIANLPSEIRDELNYRLNDGEPGNELVEWLNAKPEVIKVITERFDGRPISEQCTARKRHFQDVAERSLHRGRSLKTSLSGGLTATANSTRITSSSTN